MAVVFVAAAITAPRMHAAISEGPKSKNGGRGGKRRRKANRNARRNENRRAPITITSANKRETTGKANITEPVSSFLFFFFFYTVRNVFS